MPVPTISQQLEQKADRTKRLNYPNKLFNLAEHFIPSDMKSLFRFTWYYYLTHPALYQAISRSSEYPVTDIVFNTEDEGLKDRYEELFYRHWKIRAKMIECGNSERVFGNTFVSVNFSPVRYIECPACRKRTRLTAAAKREDVRWNAARLRYEGPCPKRGCSHNGAFSFKDIHPRKPEFVNLVLWSPKNMRIKHNPITGRSVYYYQIPNRIRTLIQTGDTDFLSETPEIFLDAIRENKDVRINLRNFFHMARPGISSETDGWGMSTIIPILQDLFYRGILRRAQESVAIDHVVPLRFLFPQSSPGAQPPEISLNMANWKNRMEEEVRKWRLDENYIPIVPTPIGQEWLGGQAKGLFVTPEIQQVDQNTVIGTGCPTEFVWGGLSYSGTSVSMRMLENSFMTYRDNLEEFLNFLVGVASTYLGWERVEVRLAEFKMADDALRRDTFLKLRLNNDISKDTMLSELGLDAEAETKKIRQELLRDAPVLALQQKLQATAAVEGQKVLASFEERLQEQALQASGVDPGQLDSEDTQPGGGMFRGVDPLVSAFSHAGMIDRIQDPDLKQRIIREIHTSMPEYGGLLQGILDGVYDPVQDIGGLPEQRPPTRQKGLV